MPWKRPAGTDKLKTDTRHTSGGWLVMREAVVGVGVAAAQTSCGWESSEPGDSEASLYYV